MPTDSQLKILNFIRDHIAERNRAPSLTEIAQGIGLRSKSMMHRQVSRLINEGYLTRQARQRFGLSLTDKAGRTPYNLPLVGRIAAGRPIEAISGQDEMDITALISGKGHYVLKVTGDSMIEAGIFDGDLVVIKPQNRADNGEIVVALIDGHEATLKYIRHLSNGLIELIPAHPSMMALSYAAERVCIQGVVYSLVRKYR